jgi:hypothetical protein
MRIIILLGLISAVCFGQPTTPIGVYNNSSQPAFQNNVRIQDTLGVERIILNNHTQIEMQSGRFTLDSCLFVVTNTIKIDTVTTGADNGGNTLIGGHAGLLATSNSNGLTFLGDEAGLKNTSGARNTFLGNFSGRYNTTGSSNVFVGQHTGMGNTTGSFNTYLGNSACRTVTGAKNNNTAVGYHAGFTLGTNNTTEISTFIGASSFKANTSGRYNVGLGYQTGVLTTTGEGNTYMGTNAGAGNIAGNYNVSIGFQSAYTSATTLDSNVFIGYQSGYLCDGSGNIFLGAEAGYSETGSRKLYIENTKSTTPLIYGEFDNDRIKINGSLSVDSNIIGTSSDAVNVKNASILVVNTTAGNVTIGGFVNGYLGQILYVTAGDEVGNIIIEDDEGTGNQDIKTNTGSDVTITNGGGVTLVFTGTTWRMVSVAL